MMRDDSAKVCGPHAKGEPCLLRKSSVEPDFPQINIKIPFDRQYLQDVSSKRIIFTLSLRANVFSLPMETSVHSIRQQSSDGKCQRTIGPVSPK